MGLASPGQHVPPHPPPTRHPGTRTLTKPGLEVKTSRESLWVAAGEMSQRDRDLAGLPVARRSLEGVLCVCACQAGTCPPACTPGGLTYTPLPP